jgi:hypothetical protein
MYSFLNVPALNNGDVYYVRYLNPYNTAGNLWLWHTRTLERVSGIVRGVCRVGATHPLGKHHANS